MVATSNPFGFIAVRSRTGGGIHTQSFGSRTLGINGIAAANTNVIYIGQTVKELSTGLIDRAAAGDTNTVGVFAGCEYDDANGHHIVGYWPGTAGATNIVAWVWTDPNIIFQVQGDAGAGLANIGENFNISNATNGSTATQRSQQTLGISTTTTSAAQYQLVGIVDRPDNAASDAFTLCEVKLNLNSQNASYSGV